MTARLFAVLVDDAIRAAELCQDKLAYELMLITQRQNAIWLDQIKAAGQEKVADFLRSPSANTWLETGGTIQFMKVMQDHLEGRSSQELAVVHFVDVTVSSQTERYGTVDV